MSAISAQAAFETPAVTVQSPVRRVGSVMRLLVLGRWSWIYAPPIILAAVFLLGAVAALVTKAYGGHSTVFGGGVAVIWFLFVMSPQSVRRSFPLAIALGVTRSQYVAGVAALFAAMAVAVGVVYTALSYPEQATDGWGLGQYMFSALIDTGESPVARFAGVAVTAFAAMTVPAVFAAAFLRFGAVGLVGGLITVGLVVIALIWWGTSIADLDALGRFFTGLTVYGAAGLGLFTAVLALAGSWLLLRRAVA